jgi:hypothetical protein
MVELFVFFEIARMPSFGEASFGARTVEIVRFGGALLPESLVREVAQFDVRNTSCTCEDDRQVLLCVIEYCGSNGLSGADSFNAWMREIALAAAGEPTASSVDRAGHFMLEAAPNRSAR